MAQEHSKSNLERQIEENLRRVYQKTVEEDVPDRFRNLLEQLREQEAVK